MNREDHASGETTPEPEDRHRPLLRVVRGDPDDTELAALTAVVAGLASASGTGDGDSRPRSRWADRAALIGAGLRPGNGAWRASGFPRGSR